MEFAPRIHLIAGLVGTRPLQLFLLNGTSLRVLLDTGCSTDPQKIIFPYLHSVGLGAQDIDMVINTHCDMDHCGGNYAIKRSHPQVQITCGEKDRALIEDPQTMWERRYNAYDKQHGMRYDETARHAIFAAMGNSQPVDFTWKGGETVDLGDGWQVEIHHTPGHSMGHLAVFDPRSRTLLSGDAVHGSMYPDVHGNPVLCPTYLHVADYLNTIYFIELLQPNCLATCHWPLKRGDDVPQFLAESRAFALRAEQLTLSELQRASSGLTLRDLVTRLGPLLGSWPHTVNSELMYAVSGHLEHLVSQQRVLPVSKTYPMLFKAIRN